jgi:hypothetical protein
MNNQPGEPAKQNSGGWLIGRSNRLFAVVGMDESLSEGYLSYRKLGSNQIQFGTLRHSRGELRLSFGVSDDEIALEKLSAHHTKALTGLSCELPVDILIEILADQDEILGRNPDNWGTFSYEGTLIFSSRSDEVVALVITMDCLERQGPDWDPNPIAVRLDNRWVSMLSRSVPHSSRELLQVGPDWWTEYPVYHSDYPPYDYEVSHFEVWGRYSHLPSTMVESFATLFDSPLPLTSGEIEGFLAGLGADEEGECPDLLVFLSQIILGYGMDEGTEASPLEGTATYDLALSVESEAPSLSVEPMETLVKFAEHIGRLDPRLLIESLINLKEMSDDMIEIDNAFGQTQLLDKFISWAINDDEFFHDNPVTILAEDAIGFTVRLSVDFKGTIMCSPDPSDRFAQHVSAHSHAAVLKWKPENSVPDTGVAHFFDYPSGHPEIHVALALYTLRTLNHDRPFVKYTIQWDPASGRADVIVP